MTDAEELREWLGKMLYWAKVEKPVPSTDWEGHAAFQAWKDEIRKAEEVYKRTGK